MVGERCGLPLPSEVIMPTAGLLAATGHMQGGLIAAILAGALANLVGSLVAYVLAARFGEPLLLGPGRYVGIRRHHLEMADGWFRRWGLLAVFIGRVLPVIRTYISFPAGLARIDLATCRSGVFVYMQVRLLVTRPVRPRRYLAAIRRRGSMSVSSTVRRIRWGSVNSPS